MILSHIADMLDTDIEKALNWNIDMVQIKHVWGSFQTWAEGLLRFSRPIPFSKETGVWCAGLSPLTGLRNWRLG